MWSSIKESAPIISPILLTIIGLINLLIAIRVFGFNKKNSYSKISVQPIQEDGKRDVLKTGLLHEKVYKNDISYEGKGFPTKKCHHEEIEWKIKVLNRGDHASTNIRMKYTLVIERSEFDYNEQQVIVKNHRFVDYKSFDGEINIPYISADGEKEFSIISMIGNFPRARLIINELKTNENKFIQMPVVIDKYENPEYGYLSDDTHYRAFLGVYEYPVTSNERTIYKNGIVER